MSENIIYVCAVCGKEITKDFVAHVRYDSTRHRMIYYCYGCYERPA